MKASIGCSPHSHVGRPTSHATAVCSPSESRNLDQDASGSLEASQPYIPNMQEDGQMGSARTPKPANDTNY